MEEEVEVEEEEEERIPTTNMPCLREALTVR
jgi:hypothetical protein